MPNLLARESSPYLLQHKDNPVEWLPWGQEAFSKAATEDKPVFLSVGYSSCHWCHVMAHESFEDLEIASVLNRGFVNIKVDREELPDVDEAYMTAVQLQSGRGGWPMSVFLTPDGAPFFAGTYFPKPGFLNILKQLDAMWRTQKPQIAEAAEEFRKSLEAATERPAPNTFRTLDLELIEEAFQAIVAEYDSKNGGFGGAPKFPPHSTLSFLLALGKSTSVKPTTSQRAKEMALHTLERMTLGGIHDHVGGGFHRYSTDEHWLLPHFEKMLYDNALILENLAAAADLASSPRKRLFESARDRLIGWLETKMVTPDGLLSSAIDADSEGEEGKYYTWTAQELREVLGHKADAFLRAYGFNEAGNFKDEATRKETGANVPHLAEISNTEFENELAALRDRRDEREPPLRDGKGLIGWNGLAIAALRRANCNEMADQTVSAIERHWKPEEPMPHLIADGRPSGRAYLEDVAGLLWGVDEENLKQRLVEQAKAFQDTSSGNYFATSDAHEKLFGRTKPIFDQPIPSANAILARSFVRMGMLEQARSIVEANIGWLERAPSSTAAMALAALELLEAEGVAQATENVTFHSLKPGEIVSAELSNRWRVDKDGWARGSLTLTIREGFHVNTNEPPARWLKPTTLEIQGLEAKFEYPKGMNDRYEGSLAFPVKVKGRGEFELTLRCQPCSETECLDEVEKRLTGTIQL